MRILLPITYTLLITTLLWSCGGSTDKAEEMLSEIDSTSYSSEESKFNAQNVFNSLPDRKTVMKLIDEHKLVYDPDLLNNPTSVNNYALEAAKAINLGIYGSDLSISSSFDQTQESMLFLRCVNVLAQQLGVNAAFDQRLFERIDANESNKDSVIDIVTNAFRRVDEILKVNNRPATSAVILSGCWIEGLYVSCRIAEKVDAENIIKTIIQQKESLRNLVVMLENVTLDEKTTFLLADLKDLYKSFEIADTQTEYNKKTIAEITGKIAALRTKVTSVV